MTCPRPADFQEADPGKGWDRLPLPALVVDGKGRIAALNDTAEIWLNLSRKSALGKVLDGDELASRLRVVPPIEPLLRRVRRQDDGFYHPDVIFHIGDRAGGIMNRPRPSMQVPMTVMARWNC